MTDLVRPSNFKPTATALVIGGWMLVQAMVVIFTGSVRLWTHHPDPPQSVALVELVVVQIMTVAVFCPLIDGWDRVLMMSAGALFFDQIAAIQSAAPVAGAIRAGLAIGLWIIGARLANGNAQRTFAIAPFVLALSTIVPLMLRYSQATGSDELRGRFCALLGRGIVERVVGQIDRGSLDVLTILLPGIALATATLIWRIVRPKPCKSPHFTPPAHNSIT